jgi:hypothetical protein
MIGIVLFGVVAVPVAVAAEEAVLAPWREDLTAALSLREAVAEAVWPGWTAPFDLLLLDGEREVLVGRSPAPDGFDPAAADAELGPVATRGAVLPARLLATMPLFGPPPTLVVGSPAGTGKTPTEWILVLLHEHFHQWQMRDGSYYEATAALGLDGGDTTGRWMLEYPFPYDDPEVGAAFAAASRHLGALLRRPRTPLSEAAGFWHRHAELVAGLDPAAARYLDFQLWQEGVARFVELRVAEEGATRWAPVPGGLAETRRRELPEVARAARGDLLAELESPDLARRRRVSFYAYGAGAALLLDRTEPEWKARYEAPRFRLEPAGSRD